MAHALVIGESGGIGSALAEALRARGDQVRGLSRARDGFDVTDPASVARHLGRLEEEFDLIVVATGALEIGGRRPEKALRQITPEAMVDQFRLHALGPALVLREAPRLMPRGRRAVFAALSARVGSIGDNRLGGWHSYRASKAALNQIIRGAAIELARTHPKAACVALHPGTVATPFTRRYLGAHPAVTPEHAATRLLGVIDGLDAAHNGRFLDYAGRDIAW